MMTTDAPSSASARAIATPMPAVETVTKAFFPSSRKFIASSSFSLLRFVYVVDPSFPAQMIDREAIVRPARQQQVVNRCVKHLYAKRFPSAAQRCAEYECGNQQPAADPRQSASTARASAESQRLSRQMAVLVRIAGPPAAAGAFSRMLGQEYPRKRQGAADAL